MKAVDIKSLVGAKVRRLREKARWSQENLGFESGLHRNYIGGIERGERNVSIVNLALLGLSLLFDRLDRADWTGDHRNDVEETAHPRASL